jgi:hypothetical protein
MKTSIRSAVAFVALLASPLSAQTLLTDNFNAENGGAASVLNYASFANWNVTGAVDLIKTPDFGIPCAGGSGMCVDMSGSQGVAGTLTSKLTYSFAANDLIRLSIDVSGNARTSATDSFTAALLLSSGTNAYVATSTGMLSSSAFIGANLVRSTVNVAGNAAMQTGTLEFRAATAGTVTIQLSTTAANNIGPILDNVSLVNVSTVPEPGTYALMAAGLSALLIVQRRRRKQ